MNNERKEMANEILCINNIDLKATIFKSLTVKDKNIKIRANNKNKNKKDLIKIHKIILIGYSSLKSLCLISSR
tara:strand:- start:99 stop:317 length:219 start_codon:yes stop_codon:yes gene_type:complete